MTIAHTRFDKSRVGEFFCFPIGAPAMGVVKHATLPSECQRLQNALPARRSRSGVWGIPQQAKIRLGSTQTLLATMLMTKKTLSIHTTNFVDPQAIIVFTSITKLHFVSLQKFSCAVDFDNDIVYNIFELILRGDQNGLHDRAYRHRPGTWRHY